MKKIFRFWPIIVLFLITLGLGMINYKFGTWLTGWDNLHPEFNFWINIKRSLFAVWQEYQGLGLLGGMGHATALPREISLLIMSFVVPVHLLRYVWTIGMLGIGAAGTYLLLQQYLLPKILAHGSQRVIKTAALIGSLFYLTNLATIQMFHVPYEAFSAHFGYLPWLIYGFLLLLEHPTRKRIIFFTILNIISATQAYVPTLFVVYGVILGIISFVHLLSHRSRQIVGHLGITFFILLLTNMYWMLPFVYFTATRSQVNISAKINQMATEEVYLRNKAFGSLSDTIQLKGFWFDTFDFDPQKGQTTPLLTAWQKNSDQLLVVISSYVIFTLIVIGGISLFIKRRHATWWIAIAGMVSITMLTTDTAPFSWINDTLRQHIPIMNQAFRFPFTKWGIMNGWLYSLLLAVCSAYLLTWIRHLHDKKVGQIILLCCISGILFIQSVPLLSGNLFYEPMQQKIPQYYFDLFSYFQNKPIGRIANLPQTSYWGWTYYRWGYSGSGFPWYGIEQPILDRAFDPWSRENENYYWELSLAIYSKDSKRLQAVFQKYDVKYIMFDDSVISPSHARALFPDEIKQLLAADPLVHLDRQFGPISVYERQIPTNEFVGMSQKLPNVLPVYSWGDADQAALDYGTYKTDSSAEADSYYPFRSLFTKRSVNERLVTIKEEGNSLVLESSIPEPVSSLPLALPASATETAQLFMQENVARVQINKEQTLQYDSATDPSVPIQPNNVVPCGTGNKGQTNVEEHSDFGGKFLSFETTSQRLCLSIGVQSLYHKVGYVVAIESRHEAGRELLFSVINQTAKHSEFETYLPNITNWTTSYFIIPPLASDGLGYTLYFSNDSIGRVVTKNDLRSIRIYQIPYQELVQLREGNAQPTEFQLPLSVSHPNPSYYSAIIPYGKSTIMLYQTFHPGWKAYEVDSELGKMFPFLFGKELKKHVIVNNWANGWEISKESGNGTIVIFFLPQLLQWFGFILLPLPFLMVILLKRPPLLKLWRAKGDSYEYRQNDLVDELRKV
jgi:hypothetical protein